MENTELLDMLIGTEPYVLGTGAFRTVYHCVLNNEWVVKVAHNLGARKHNILENQVWQAVSRLEINRWFAPIIAMSPQGQYLIQQKTTPAHMKPRKLPEKVPYFFTDMKAPNYGWIKDQFVAHDYAYTFDMVVGTIKRPKMVDLKFNWEYSHTISG